MGIVVRLSGEELAVFCLSDGTLCALENKNLHVRGGPLAEGIVSGHYLYDPLYDTKINLLNGKVEAPEMGYIKTYPLNITEDGLVQVHCLSMKV
ncbi:MAG: nitrite reductase (NAD(P)H) small subunit [Gorillibacterium sp.]|nr:nitrite reductase (NAD(P)H) small subunit [Gorillibacterium sp.]